MTLVILFGVFVCATPLAVIAAVAARSDAQRDTRVRFAACSRLRFQITRLEQMNQDLQRRARRLQKSHAKAKWRDQYSLPFGL